MKKVTSMNDINVITKYSVEVIENITNTVGLLDENYGVERNIETDLGGYLLIAENIVDIEVLKNGKLDGVEAEYTDLIKCKEGGNYTSSLFLLSSDFSIVVVTTQDLSKLLLE